MKNENFVKSEAEGVAKRNPSSLDRYLSNEVPIVSMDLMINAWEDFKHNQSDYDKFRTIDWIMNVAIRKWQNYADNRKASGT